VSRTRVHNLAGTPAGSSLAPGTNCALAINFAPTTTGNLQGNVVIGDTNLNAANALQSISMTGSGSVASTSLALSAPASAIYGNPVQVTASVINEATNGPVTGGTVNFSDANGGFGSQTLTNGVASKSYLAPSVGSFTLNGAFTSPNGNYAKASGQTTIQIMAAPLNILADSATRIYGAANPKFTGSITGAVNNDSFAVTFTNAATVSTGIGSYPIVPSALGSNLAITARTYRKEPANHGGLPDGSSRQWNPHLWRGKPEVYRRRN